MRFKIPKQQPANFKASALYLAGHAKGQNPDRVAWVEARNLQTEDPRAAAAIMEATAAQNLRCKQNAYHFVITFDPKDAKAGKVNHDIIREIAGEAIERLGLAEHQMLVYGHKDTEHPHMHFLVNRVHPVTGKAYDRHNDGRNLTGMCRDIARERGLNIPKDRAKMLEREQVDDFDDIGSAPTDGEYWQAKREERQAQEPFTKDQLKILRADAQGHFYNAESWDDLSARLGAQGIFLERKGQGLVVSKGEQFAKLSQMGKGIRLAEMEERFGERFDSHMARRAQELADKHIEETQPKGWEDMSPAEHRRAERLIEAQNAVDRKHADPIREVDNADHDFRYWQGLQASYRHGERRVKRMEKNDAWLNKLIPTREKAAQRAKVNMLDFVAKAFRKPERALQRWDKLEAEHGIAEARRMIAKRPRLLGGFRGVYLFGMETAERKKAKRAFRYLDNRRKRLRESHLKLGDLREKIKHNRQNLSVALRDFGLLQKRMDSPDQLRKIIMSKIKRRSKALERVTEKAIRESDLAENRKADFIRSRRAWLKRKKELERTRERDRHF